jgi:SNF2 family DNA or RNA helicase
MPRTPRRGSTSSSSTTSSPSSSTTSTKTCSQRPHGYQDTKVWQSLYNFQRDAATGIINKLETYNGCILADSVGLGRRSPRWRSSSTTSCATSPCSCCPKKLAENWTNYNANLTTNIFASDRFNYDVLAHTDLSRTEASRSGPLDRINWGNYDLVVIDESHNFRNADYAEEKESRYQRLMRQVIAKVKTKVLMLSATPVNNRSTTSRISCSSPTRASDTSPPSSLSTSVERVFRDAQTVFNEWSSSHRGAHRRPHPADARLRLLRAARRVTIARSRKHIQAFYDTSEIGAFPTTPPASIREPLTDLRTFPRSTTSSSNCRC